MSSLPFKEQIDEDLNFIKETYIDIEPRLYNKSYAFNFWVLTKLYEIDEELAVANITEYNDKSIDCFVHFEESKELFLIQNKYYDDKTNLNRKDIGDFLTAPLNALKEGNYKNKELQNAFNSAKNDNEYKIWLHFYITHEKINSEIQGLFSNFNITENKDFDCEIRAKVFNLQDIKDKYFGHSFKERKNFDFTLESLHKGTVLNILPEEYKLQGMSEAHYVMTPITFLFKMYKESLSKDYPLFDENIREYLGRNSINNNIAKTLEDSKDRKNFFYYNNGITVICNKIVDKSATPNYRITLQNPQIVNGCQTVSTINEVLSDYETSRIDIEEEFKDVYVIAKILIMDEKDPQFYKKVVKYTNSQNSINEKTFASVNDFFFRIQKFFEEKGFLLLVKQSDNNKFKSEYSERSTKNELISKAKKFTSNIGLEINNINDLMIPLDKLLQVFIAFVMDGYEAYTKKNLVLNRGQDIYDNYSLKITDYLSIENLIRLFILYKKAENDKKNSEDKKTPVPFYLIGFMGYFIKIKNFNTLNNMIQILFSYSENDFNIIYNYFKVLTQYYKYRLKVDYNIMIKQKIDNQILDEEIARLNMGIDRKVMEFINKTMSI